MITESTSLHLCHCAFTLYLIFVLDLWLKMFMKSWFIRYTWLRLCICVMKCIQCIQLHTRFSPLRRYCLVEAFVFFCCVCLFKVS